MCPRTRCRAATPSTPSIDGGGDARQGNGATFTRGANTSKVSPRWLAEEENAMQRVKAQAANFPVPLLILVGGADRNASPEASKAFFQQVTLSDKQLHEYAGAYTNLLSDSVSEAVLSDIDT